MVQFGNYWWQMEVVFHDFIRRLHSSDQGEGETDLESSLQQIKLVTKNAFDTSIKKAQGTQSMRHKAEVIAYKKLRVDLKKITLN